MPCRWKPSTRAKFRWKVNINSDTVLFTVLGDPVSHCLGPLMHNTAFSELGYNGAYLAFRVKDIGKAVAGIKAPVDVMIKAVLNALGKNDGQPNIK